MSCLVSLATDTITCSGSLGALTAACLAIAPFEIIGLFTLVWAIRRRNA